MGLTTLFRVVADPTRWPEEALPSNNLNKVASLICTACDARWDYAISYLTNLNFDVLVHEFNVTPDRLVHDFIYKLNPETYSDLKK